MTHTVTPAALRARLREIGVSKSYASEIASAKRTASERVALRLWRASGLKIDPVADISDPDLEVLARLRGVQ